MSIKTRMLAFLPLILSLSACAHAAGTQPSELSVAQHEGAAAQEETLASEHAGEHDPAAQQVQKRCMEASVTGGDVCWTETDNPTQEHLKAAERHRKLAAQHRAASGALASAEARACAGIGDNDRDTSPFAHAGDIRSVSQLREDISEGDTMVPRDAGATIVFRATPGLTAEWLQRIVDCHLARNAAVGHDMPEMPYCPLVPRGAQATVHSVRDGFAVDVRADDPAAATEIWLRAQLLMPSH